MRYKLCQCKCQGKGTLKPGEADQEIFPWMRSDHDSRTHQYKGADTNVKRKMDDEKVYGRLAMS